MPRTVRITFRMVSPHAVLPLDVGQNVRAEAIVGGQAITIRPTPIGVTGGSVVLDESCFCDVSVNGAAAPINVVFRVIDPEDGSELSRFTHQVPSPYNPDVRRDDVDGILDLDWDVQDLTPEVPRGQPWAVQACRQRWESGTATTVSGRKTSVYLEVHPVRPRPTDRPRARMFMRSIRGWDRGSYDGTLINPGSPENVVPNPPVVPILAGPSNSTCARIQCTYYAPAYMNFQPKDKRLRWEAQGIGAPGGEIQFHDDPVGLSVLVYGTAPGQALLTVRHVPSRTELAKYRVLVAPLVRVRTRVNILVGSTGGRAYRPRSTSADIRDHLKVANRLLRQMGIELAFDLNDTDTAVGTSVKKAGITNVLSQGSGIFQVTLRDDYTRNVRDADDVKLSDDVHLRTDALNICYIKQFKATGLERLGAIFNMRTLGLTWTTQRHGGGMPPTFIDNGTPPTSHYPNRLATNTHTMHLFHSNGYGRGFAVADAHGLPSSPEGKRHIGNTIAHEFGHLLALDHRIEGARWKGGAGGNADHIGYPPRENVMHWNSGYALAQDFDIIQALAVRNCDLLGAGSAYILP